VMKVLFKIGFVIIALSLLPYAAEAQLSNPRYSRAQPEILPEMKKREQIIISRLTAEKNKKTRKELINKLIQIQDLYSTEAVRTEFIRKNSPEYFEKHKNKQHKRTRTESLPKMPETRRIPLNMLTANTFHWESYPTEDKIKFCGQIKRECDAKKKLEDCRFVVVKCKSYISDEDYTGLVNRYKRSD